MRKRYLLVLGFVLAVVGAVVFCRSVGQRPLADYLAQLRARGEPLTFAELAATRSPSSGDTARALTNAAKSLGPFRVAITNRVAFPLTLSEVASASRRSVAPPLMVDTDDELVVLPWPECHERVSARAAVLAELREALKTPAPHANLGSNWLARATPVREVRCCADWLYLAALVDVHEGRPAAAFTNVQALTALANYHREESQLLSQLTRVSVGSAAQVATRELLTSDAISEAQWADLQRSWEFVDLLAGLERAAEGERCYFLEAFNQAIAQQSSARTGLMWPLYRRTVVDNDVLFGLHHIQGTVECARELRQGRPWPEVDGRLRELAAELKGKSSRPQRYLYLFTLASVPEFSRKFSSFVEVETGRRLTITAIALKRYHLAYGAWPKTLEALVPQFLAAVPRDCLNGKPLGYEVNGDGNPVILSVISPPPRP